MQECQVHSRPKHVCIFVVRVFIYIRKLVTMQDEELDEEVLLPDHKRAKPDITMTKRANQCELPLYAFPRDTFCIACSFYPQDQSSPLLQNALTQMHSRLATSQMGHDFKIESIKKYYKTTLRNLMPEGTEEWTDTSIENHMNALHGNATSADISKLDLVFRPKLMKLLEGALIKTDTLTGEKELNIAVIALRLKLTATIAATR